MEKFTYVIQIPEVIDDPDGELETFGAFTCKIYKQGNGSGLARVFFRLTDSIKIEVVGAELFSDAAGLNSLGKSVEKGAGYQELYLRMIENVGQLIFNDAENISRLTNASGGSFFDIIADRSNSPYVELDLGDLPLNLSAIYESGYNKVTGNIKDLRNYKSLVSPVLKSIRNYTKNTCGGELIDGDPIHVENMNYDSNPNSLSVISLAVVKPISINFGGGYPEMLRVIGSLKDVRSDATNLNIGNVDDRVTGDLSDLSTKYSLDAINMASNTTVGGNILDIPSSVKYINLPLNDKVTYTSGRAWANGMKHLGLKSTKLSLSVVETMLIELSNTTWDASFSGKAIFLGCRETVQLSPSAQAAITSLNNQGVTVTILKVA